jgi:hypothetical protein
MVALLGACSSGAKPSARTTSTTSSSTSTVPPTSTTAAATTLVGPVTTQKPTECIVPERRAPDPQRPRYVLHVDVRPSEERVVGDLTVRFTPDRPADRLVFRLWPNGPRLSQYGAHLSVGAVQVGPHPASTEQPDPTTLVVLLGGYIDAGQTIEATVPWELHLASANNDRIAHAGDSIRLGSFFPILAWEPGYGWAIEGPAQGFAEASTAPVADFDVGFTVPDGYDVFGSGVPDANRTRWHAEAMRDVAFSIGHFKKAEADGGGVHVTVGVAADVNESPATYAQKIASKLDILTKIFGPLPANVYTVAVTPSLKGGIEYPTHVMQGPGSIGRTTTHELSHQWFYGLVGNNQGRDPWLDEGLATYAEARGEGSMGSLLAMSIPADARGHMTSPIDYWNAHQSSYYRGVYVQTVQALSKLGPVDRLDCALRIYIAENAYTIARPANLVAALSAVFGDTTKLAPYGVTSAP